MVIENKPTRQPQIPPQNDSSIRVGHDVLRRPRGDAGSMGPTSDPRGSSPPDSGAVCRAWSRYLADTRTAAADDYPAIEERAWHRLVSNLGILGVQLEPPDPAAARQPKPAARYTRPRK
jgi:hypothetical protein